VLIVARHGGTGADVPIDVRLAGVAFSIASAVLYAGFTLVSGRLSQSLGAGPATTCLTVVRGDRDGLVRLVPAPGVADRSGARGLAALSRPGHRALALLAFSWGAARLSPTALTVATLVEPMTAVALAALLLGQRLSPGQCVGGVLLVASIWGWAGVRAGVLPAFSLETRYYVEVLIAAENGQPMLKRPRCDPGVVRRIGRPDRLSAARSAA
jgi:DME family drug/metabolite transporter